MSSWLRRIPLALLVGGMLISDATAGTSPTPVAAGPPAPGPTAAVAAAPIPPPGLATPLDATADRPAAPIAIRIPAIGVDDKLVALATDATGVLVPPASPADPGWFTEGAVPGEVGPAIIAGHVDSRSGPGVFYRLRELRPGDEIEVERPDTIAVFQVRSTETIGKAEFPTRSVYGPVPVPELRLITCGGDFARSTGHYVDNVIVRAGLVRLRTTSP